MYIVMRMNGKVRGVGTVNVFFPIGSQQYDDFLLWNAQQLEPLDVSDHAPPVQPTLQEQAVVAFNDPQIPSRVVDRAIVLAAIDEINLLRTWITDFKVAVAGAASLAALKTAVAALPAVPQRTAVQAKSAIEDKIESGGAD